MLVRDIMQTDIVSVSPDMSARRLARTLADNEISGVPVLGDNRTLVGVVSQTDLVRLAARDSGSYLAGSALQTEAAQRDPEDEPAELDPYSFFLPEESPFSRSFLDAVPESEFDAATVADIMTPVLFSVRSDLSVPELADFLVRGRIHRAVVVEDEQLLGIVTANDVLRAVAQRRAGR